MNSFVNEDISKLGLSERVDAKLKRLQEENHFADMRDAYRVGIALAIAYGIRPPEVMQHKVGRYNISQIDEDKSIETTISLLMDTEGIPPYRWAERLAEWGVEKLSQESEKGQIDFSRLLMEAKEIAKDI